MAPRCGAIIAQENLAPDWLLVSFDSNWNLPVNALNDSSLGYVNYAGTDTGSANIYACSLALGSPTAYQQGFFLAFLPAHTNTGASTMTVSPLGSIPILHLDGTALTGGEMTAGVVQTMVCNGTAFLLLGPTSTITASSIAALLNGAALLFNTSLQYVGKPLGTVTTNQSVDCANASGVVVSMSTATSGLNLTLTHLATGVPVTIFVQNTAGGLITLGIQATTPANANMTCFGMTPLGVINFSVAGLSLNGGSAALLTGGAIVSAGVVYLSDMHN